MATISEAIHSYASENGKTIGDVAADLGIGRVSLYNKMRGEYSFTLREGYMLSRFLGLTLDDFYEMTQR